MLILFVQEKFDDAAKWYTEFTQLYPGNKLVEYASYKSIICSFKKILSPDRDQSPTEKTLELTNTFLGRADVFIQYKAHVEKIKRQCEQTLAKSDCNIAEFYITHGPYSSAQRRLAQIRTDWLVKVPEISTTIANLEVQLGTQWSEFTPPESSIKLAQAAKPPKKIDMTRRF